MMEWCRIPPSSRHMQNLCQGVLKHFWWLVVAQHPIRHFVGVSFILSVTFRNHLLNEIQLEMLRLIQQAMSFLVLFIFLCQTEGERLHYSPWYTSISQLNSLIFEVLMYKGCTKQLPITNPVLKNDQKFNSQIDFFFL